MLITSGLLIKFVLAMAIAKIPASTWQQVFFFFIWHIYLAFMRKRIVSLYMVEIGNKVSVVFVAS